MIDGSGEQVQSARNWGMRVGVARERMAAAGPRLREQSWRARALVRSRLARASDGAWQQW